MIDNSHYKNKYGFIGKEKDNESGLNYVEARYYDSNLGRFVAQDKMFWEVGQTKRGIGVMTDPQQFNSYSYARNNPVILKDPSGESLDLLGDDIGTPVTQAAALYVGAVVAAGKALSDQLDIVVDAVSNMSVPVVPTGPDTTYQQQTKQANQSGAGTTAPAGNPALSQNSSISLSGSPSPGGGNNGKKDEGKKEGKTDNNKIKHIFGNSEHKLDSLVKKFGSEEKAFSKLMDATKKQLKTKNGIFEEVINVGGIKTTVRGAVVDGVVKIGTAFIP